VTTIETWLRAILRCPTCTGVLRDAPVAAGPSGDLNAEAGPIELQCLVCQVAYAVEDGIPVLLPDLARPLQEE